ncbi:MAG: hypothetical protein KGJ79_05255 [Alphaproteobacteria bacterium]|nr:hypothetical protein [Alphaproteobacteria bacterium]
MEMLVRRAEVQGESARLEKIENNLMWFIKNKTQNIASIDFSGRRMLTARDVGTFHMGVSGHVATVPSSAAVAWNQFNLRGTYIFAPACELTTVPMDTERTSGRR